MANDVDVVEILGRLAPLHPRSDAFAGEILLRLGRTRSTARWQAHDFWPFAARAAVAYIRAVAYRAGVPASEVCGGFIRSEPVTGTTWPMSSW